MPIHYSIDTHARVVISRVRGDVAFQDFVDYADRLRNDSQFAPEFSELIDLTQSGVFAVDFTEASILSQYIDPFSPQSRRAIVATTPANTGSARMWQMLRDHPATCEIFKAAEDAWLWISSEATLQQRRPETCPLPDARPES